MFDSHGVSLINCAPVGLHFHVPKHLSSFYRKQSYCIYLDIIYFFKIATNVHADVCYVCRQDGELSDILNLGEVASLYRSTNHYHINITIHQISAVGAISQMLSIHLPIQLYTAHLIVNVISFLYKSFCYKICKIIKNESPN